MNDQLLSHLKSFDSDAAFSEGGEGLFEEQVLPSASETQPPLVILHANTVPAKKGADTLGELALVLQEALQDWISNLNGNFALKVLGLLPVTIALGDYLGLVNSFALSFSLLMLLQHAPITTKTTTKTPKNTQPNPPDASNTSADTKDSIPISNVTVTHNMEFSLELAQFLGVIGAPPLHWRSHPSPRSRDSQPLTFSHAQCIELIQAHVALVQTLDEAHRWLSISASLSLGLGSHSQSVERVERATWARARKQSQPSPLALSQLRTHLAQTILRQSESLWELEAALAESLELANIPWLVVDEEDHESRLEPVEAPPVVDLVWIKASRHRLARLLSEIAHQFIALVVDDGSNVSLGDTLISLLQESTANARLARAHLVELLMLPLNQEAALPTSPGSAQELSPPIKKDPLQKSLMQYQEQLNALSAAVWSCQQDDETNRPDWWQRIQDLAATCRALEQDIAQRYFVTLEDDDDENSSESGGEDSPVASQAPVDQESFEHGTNVPTPVPESTAPQTKTMVYKGQGKKQKERHRKIGKSGATSTSTDETPVLPPRDTISEFLMVKELQKRISMISQPEEEDETEEGFLQVKAEQSAVERALQARAPTAPLFLGVSGPMLNELKLAIPSSGKEAEEEILGE